MKQKDLIPKLKKLKWSKPIKVKQLLESFNNEQSLPEAKEGVYAVISDNDVDLNEIFETFVKLIRLRPNIDSDNVDLNEIFEENKIDILGDDTIIYIGKSDSVKRRIGDLIADIFGFYGDKVEEKKKRGHHSGGQTIHQSITNKKKIDKIDISSPFDLYLSWAYCENPEEMEELLLKITNPGANIANTKKKNKSNKEKKLNKTK